MNKNSLTIPKHLHKKQFGFQVKKASPSFLSFTVSVELFSIFTQIIFLPSHLFHQWVFFLKQFCDGFGKSIKVKQKLNSYNIR